MSEKPYIARPSSEEIDAFRRSKAFDEAWYLNEYPDVAKSGIDPAEHYLWLGRQLGRVPAEGILCDPASPKSEYLRWLALHDAISPADITAMKAASSGWARKPFFSVIMPVYNTPERLLREALDSVIAQAYTHWEICIADDHSPSPHMRRILDEYTARDQRIKVIYRERNGHISEASNSALSIATGEWFALMDHDDQLPPHALYCMAHAIVQNPDVKMLYSDEDKINPAGQRENPYFKPDFNLELLRSQNMISHFGIYHRSLIDRVGFFRSEFNGAQDYDLALRCIEILRTDQIYHVPRILYHWRVVEGSTALSASEKPYAMLAGERALNAHYRRSKINANAEITDFGYRARHHLDQKPLISIIIPTRNAKNLVKRCIDSIVLKTTYENYEILLVDNGSDESEAITYFSTLSTDPRISVIRDNRPFNYSAINNDAVKHCSGELLVLLNNDTEVISPDWLETMAGHAMQSGVGAVGAKLLYPDGKVQHAGVIIGIGGVAGHAHLLYDRNDCGYFSRLGLCSEYSAVTAACLMVKKHHFLMVGGLNETDLTVAFNDVDFCLKLKNNGLRNIYCSFAEVYHHESATRGYEHESPTKQARFNRECAYMIKTWGDVIANDPAYNPNLTLEAADFRLAPEPRVRNVW